MNKINLIKSCKSKLAFLKHNNLYVVEKDRLIEDIYLEFNCLTENEKHFLETWLEDRYKKVLHYILEYKESAHQRVNFSYDVFRWGIAGVVAQDVEYAVHLIKPIILKKVDASDATFAYANYAYGTSMFHIYRESVYAVMSDTAAYEESLKSLTISSTAKSLYLQQRSFYFLANLDTLKGDFYKSAVYYFKAMSYKSVLTSQYGLIFDSLTGNHMVNIFQNVLSIFSKENIYNIYFWELLHKHIALTELQTNIQFIMDYIEHNYAEPVKIDNEKENEIITFAESLSQYYSYIVSKQSCSLKQIEDLHKNPIFTKKAKSEILFLMGTIVQDKNKDLTRAMLMFSESIDLYMNQNRFKAISNLILQEYDHEIREILMHSDKIFSNKALQEYCHEQTMGKSAWKRFVKAGFVTGNFNEEVEFLEYLQEKTSDPMLTKLIDTRLAYLYYIGHAGIRIHDYNEPDYHKAKTLFENVKDNPLVNKYLKHPTLAIYNELEVRNNTEHYLYFEKRESDKLIIVFSCAFSYSHYTQLRLFYEHRKTNVLFLNNPQRNWYSDEEWDRIARTIEQVAIKEFKKENIISYFGSMGGYAALKVGLTFGLKTIVFNPQFDMDIWLKHRPVLRPKLNEIKNLVNLQEYKIESYEQMPLYYMTSSSIEDVEAFSVFIQTISQCKNGLFVIEKIPDNVHAGIFGKVYKELQQEAILRIAQIQDDYFPSGTYTKLPYNFEEPIRFWEYIENCMDLHIIIQLQNTKISYGLTNSFMEKELNLYAIENK